MKKAFTLAEVMIVLTVIGVLTAILLPVARQSMPDENLMKFKKAHNTLGTVIRELVTSDKYYLDGDLGVRANLNQIDGTHDGDYTYFCETMADILNAKKVECSEVDALHWGTILCTNPGSFDTSSINGIKITSEILQTSKTRLDTICNDLSETINMVGAEITLQDDVIIYQTDPHITFGFNNEPDVRLMSSPSSTTPYLYDQNGFDIVYKAICIDIDGLNTGEDAFGYGIRADGKILTGARADEWLAREINQD